MATWQVSGLGADHTQDVQISVMNFISTNWSLTGTLDPSHIKFSTGWYDSQVPYQIHFRHPPLAPNVSTITLGSHPLFRYDDRVDIHVFVAALRANTEPAALGQMNREIERIVGSDTTGLESTQGFCFIKFTRPMNTLPQEDSQASTWHSIGQVGMVYHKVFV